MSGQETEIGVAGEGPGNGVNRLRRRLVPFSLAALLLLATALIVVDAIGYRSGTAGEPGPAMLPFLIAGLSTIAAVALIIQTARDAHVSEDTEEDQLPILPLRVLFAFAALIAGGYLFKQLGFFVVFTALMFVMGWLSGAKRWWLNLLLAAVMSWVVMIVFGRLFSVPLPAGPIDVLLGG